MSENSGNKVFDWIKEHPWETGIVIFIIGASIIFLFRGNASTSTAVGTTGVDATSVAAATSLQEAQLAAQSQANNTAASAGVANNQTAAQVSIATLGAQVATTNDTLSAQTAQVIANLQASVANTQTAASVSINANNDATLQAVALAPYAVEEAQIAANAAGTPAQIAALQNEIAGLSGNTTAGFEAISNLFGNNNNPGQAAVLQQSIGGTKAVATQSHSTVNT